MSGPYRHIELDDTDTFVDYQFNRAMRFKANKMGYSLNQRGLYSGVVRDPKDRRVKTNTGTPCITDLSEDFK